MNIQDLSTQLLYTTAPIFAQKQDGSITSGTGFIYSIIENESTSIPLLITNYHVLDNALSGFVELHVGEKGSPTNKSIRIQFDRTIINDNKLGDLDAIAIPLAATFVDLQKNGVEIFYRSVDQSIIPTIEQQDNLAAIENVTFIGYPSSIYDEKNKISVVRQGITATPVWNDFRGEEAFLIDAGVFPGSSGSPVFVFNQGSYPTTDGITIGNRLLFIGVLSQTMLTNSQSVKGFLNLGKVIKSRALSREIEAFVRKLKQRK